MGIVLRGMRQRLTGGRPRRGKEEAGHGGR